MSIFTFVVISFDHNAKINLVIIFAYASHMTLFGILCVGKKNSIQTLSVYLFIKGTSRIY